MFASLRINKWAVFTVLTALAILSSGLVRELKAAGDDGGAVSVPIVMYHSVRNDPDAAGEYVVTVEELEEDIRYILENGYKPVFCSELEDFVDSDGELPEKPIVITFDDGSYNNFYYVLPLLQKYHVKAVFSVVGQWCMAAAEGAEPSPVYSYMDIDNLKTMYSSGYCEIANHSWDMHELGERRGAGRMAGESEEDYRRAVYNDVTQAQKLLSQSGMTPVTYAYPYGICGDMGEQLMKEAGFDVTLSCEERVNKVAKGDYECLRFMGRFNRPSGADRKKFFSRLFED